MTVFAGNENTNARFFPEGSAGFILYTLALIAAVFMLPAVALDPASKQFIFLIGTIALWRYSWGLIHYIRSILYRHVVFPKHRRAVDTHHDALMPSHIYLLITSFRIDTETSITVYRAAIQDAIDCGVPATIVPSIVELADEFLIKEIFQHMNPPERVKLDIVRIAGTGKRDGLAQGFRAISRDMPAHDAVVAVIDGDSILEPGLIRRTAGFFKLMPDIAALTTDESCDVKGSRIIREWHDLRFAQRQILMSSMGLSKRVLTLTGRMSMFRGSIITDPAFIDQVQNDYLDHWRFGKLKFLTGDDKSSWYWILKKGWSMLYVPDVRVHTVEHPPADHFIKASTMLMFRWFGNMLRTNERALKIRPHVTGFFTWWCLMDQRLSMWTSLSGPIFATILCLKHSLLFLPIYIVWIGFTRWVMSLMLLSARWKVSWQYPFLIYYNQIWGSLIKTFVLFRLDRQSWTRQKTKLDLGLSPLCQYLNRASSWILHTVSILLFISIIGTFAGVFTFPATALDLLF